MLLHIRKNGNDDNNGKTPETAWKTLDVICRYTLYDEKIAYLFERGGVYRINKEQVGRRFKITKSNLMFAFYGDGAKPIIMDSMKNYADPSLWKETEYENAWELEDLVIIPT